jgi:hypothetical protein
VFTLRQALSTLTTLLTPAQGLKLLHAQLLLKCRAAVAAVAVQLQLQPVKLR